MKKISLIAGLIVALMSPACAQAQYSGAFSREIPEYSNPEEIIITQPPDYTETLSSGVSILGACDREYPLYMNGEEIPVTEHGYFVRYVKLAYGENIFTFTNNGKEKTVTVIKSDKPVERKLYDVPMYGVVNKNYVTHRAKPDADVNLLTPLAKGAAFKVLGEAGDYYQTEGDTYVYKTTVDIHKGELAPAVITGAAAADEGDVTYVKFAVNRGVLYDIDVTGSKARVALYAAEYEGGGPDVKETRITSAAYTIDGEKTVWEFTFAEEPVGYFVKFSRGEMAVGFRAAGDPAGDTLKGKSVVLDAGHGGHDPGALGPLGTCGPVEKDFNLYVTLAAAEYLTGRGAEVHLIRHGDTFVELKDRVSAILDIKPDISVSIHSNSMPIAMNYGESSGPLMFYTFDTGREAASHILLYVTKYIGMEYTEPERENFALTRITNCPAILFEMSFMSNPGDYEWMMKPDMLEYMGLALGKGIEDYLCCIGKL